MLFSDNQDVKAYEDVQNEKPSIEMSSEKVQQQGQGSSDNSNSVKKIKFFSNAQLMSPLQKDIVQPKDFSTPIQIAQFSQNKNPFCLYEDNDIDSSPLIKIQLSSTIKNIAEKENEQQSQDGGSGECELMRSFENNQNDNDNDDEEEEHHQIEIDPIIDLMGNRVYEFNLFGGRDDDCGQLSPIIEDKENQRPEKYHVMNTPLKIRHSELRSPLVDITPSMTNKKRNDGFNTKTNKKNRTSNKTATKCFAGFDYEKLGLLTPRTMAQSRLNIQKGNSKLVNASRIKIQRFL